MPPKSLIPAILIFLNAVFLPAQTPSYYHYTSSDGLASSTVYNIIQGRDGFIWFGTMNGLSRFDGKHFSTYRTNDGLNSNSIISLAEGENGSLYIGNYEKGINVLKNGRIGNYCDKINGKFFSISFILRGPTGNGEQKIYAYRSWGNINSISENTKGVLVTKVISPIPVHVNRLEVLPNGEIIALTPGGLFQFENEKFTKMTIAGFPETEAYCFAQGAKGSYFIGTKGMIYQINDKQVVGRHKITLAGNNDVCTIYSDSNGNIWFAIMNKGFFLIPFSSKTILDIGSKMNLQNTLVNGFLEDSEGNIWVSTFGKGAYCLNNLYLKSYNENDGLSNNSIYAIAKERSGKLLMGTFNDINILENGKFNQIKSNTGKTLTESIYSIQNINNEFYVCGAFGGSKMNLVSYKGIKFFMFNKPSVCKTSSGLFLSGTYGNSITFRRDIKQKKDEDYQLSLFGDSLKINRVNAIFEDSRKNVWFGTGLGLCKAKILTGKDGKLALTKYFFPADPVLNARINAIFQDNRNHVWFAGEKGIGSYNLGNDSVISYTRILDNDLASSTSIVSDNKNRIWIGNMKGLYVFDGRSMKFLNRKTGLPSDEVLSLYYDSPENKLYVGTSNGISILDVHLFDSYHPGPPAVKIIGIKAGDSLYTSYENLVFMPEQHDIYIDLKALNFSSPGSIRFRYKLNREWIETNYDFLNFISLKNGKYKLEIMAKAQNTGWGKPFLLSFRVLPPFIETIWFDLLVISLAVFLTLSIVIWRSRIHTGKIRKDMELTGRINELKHKALSAMMNPHFISNSLNSVQYLVNSRRYEDANDYIAMIAKLMRKNLETAGSGFVLLSEEISRLKLYLELEKLRFQDSFSYEILAGPGVITHTIMIPNMIIQPFVENSLWHGIIHSGHPGILTISFSFDDIEIDSVISRSLIVKIKDNGIGIVKAKKIPKEDHISQGIQIVEERLRLLCSKLHLPQPIMFEDLGKQDRDSQGTEVIISLPPPLYKVSEPGSGLQAEFTV